MSKYIILIFVSVLLLADTASALELSNLRVTCGPLGPKRVETEFLPGDLVFLSFDIDELQVDPKAGTVEFQSMMEIFDREGKTVLTQQASPKKILLLGGSRVPSFGFALIGADQDAGSYVMKITVTDLAAKTSKSLEYKFTLKRKDFGIVQPVVPATAFVGQDYPLSFGLVGMKRDKKKLPDVDLSVQFVDGIGQKLFTSPKKLNIKTLHNPGVSDLTTQDIIPILMPFFLNRAGRYTVQIDAVDNLSRERRSWRLPLTVIEPGNN